MIDAYKIGVRIAMHNEVSGVLRVIQRDMLGLQRTVDLTSGKFDRLKLAIGGALGIGAGAAVLDVMGKLVKAGDKLIEQQVRLKGLGVNAGNVAAATSAAEVMAQTIPGTDPAHNLQMIRELRGLLSNTQEAIAAAPAALRTQLVMDQYGGSSGDAALLQIMKAMDIKGAFVKNGQLDVASFNHAMAAAQAALTTTNGLLKPGMFYRFTRMAGPAATAMSTDQYFRDFAEVAMGVGSTGGRGLGYAAKTFLGGQLTKAQVTQLESLGLVDPRNILNDHGHYAFRAGTHVKGYDEIISKGFAQWFHDVVVPAMGKHGFHGDAAVMQALSSLPTTETRLFNFIYTNWAQIEKNRSQFNTALGVNQFGTLQSGSMALNIKDLTAAWDGLMQALGAPLVKPAIGLLKDLSGAIRGFEKWAFAHPGTVKILGETVAELGALSVVLGTFAVGTAAASALGLLTGTSGLLALAVGITALGKALPYIPHWVIKMAQGAAAGAAAGSVIPYIGTGIGAIGGALWNIDPFGGATPGDAMKWLHKYGNLNDYAPGHKYGADPQDGIKKQSFVPPSDGRLPIHLESDIYLDGNRIAKVVSAHQARALALPAPGRTGFDGRMSPSYPQNLVNA